MIGGGNARPYPSVQLGAASHIRTRIDFKARIGRKCRGGDDIPRKRDRFVESLHVGLRAVAGLGTVNPSIAPGYSAAILRTRRFALDIGPRRVKAIPQKALSRACSGKSASNDPGVPP